MTNCPACKKSLRADVFPAMFRAFPGGAPDETLLQEKEASCFYHPLKKAVIVCSYFEDSPKASLRAEI